MAIWRKIGERIGRALGVGAGKSATKRLTLAELKDLPAYKAFRQSANSEASNWLQAHKKLRQLEKDKLLGKGGPDIELRIKEARTAVQALDQSVDPLKIVYVSSNYVKRRSRDLVKEIASFKEEFFHLKGQLPVGGMRTQGYDSLGKSLKEKFNTIYEGVGALRNAAKLIAEKARIIASRTGATEADRAAAEAADLALLRAEDNLLKIHQMDAKFDEYLTNKFSQADIAEREVKDIMAILESEINTLEIRINNFAKNAASHDAIVLNQVGTGLTGASLMIGASMNSEDSMDATNRAMLDAATTAGGYYLDGLETADCVLTLGACYPINAVVEAGVDHIVAPAIEKGVAIGSQVFEVAAPVVNQATGIVSKAANDYVVKPGNDKLTKAFEMPVQVAKEATEKSTFGISLPW